MSIFRPIFTIKVVVVLALVAFLSTVPKPADARIRVKCPCTFAIVYAASIAQAKNLGLSNKVEVCLEGSNELDLNGSQSPCSTGMALLGLVSISPSCAYDISCAAPSYDYEGVAEDLSPEEVNACRRELKAIAKVSRVPCVVP